MHGRAIGGKGLRHWHRQTFQAFLIQSGGKECICIKKDVASTRGVDAVHAPLALGYIFDATQLVSLMFPRL